jgi:ABC-2 type transport system permease protein
MKKILIIGWKDLRLAFRDRAALILMLAAPFLLTLGLGLVTGRFSGSSGGLASIPLIIVNQDGGRLGNALVDVFQSSDLDQLVDPTVSSDAAAARAAVDADETAAAVMIPAGFSDSILANIRTAPVVRVEVYANPTRPTSSGVVEAIVEGFINQVELGRVNGVVSVTQLIQNGYIRPEEAARIGAEIGERAANAGSTSPLIAENPLITLQGREDETVAPPFDILAFMAPGMALMFLMFTVTNGGRTILAEQTEGTLPRLLVAPVTMAQALAGKALGIFLTGVAQMLILIGGTALLFQIGWGNWLAVIVLVLSAVFGALGWGLLLTVVARTPGQVANIGSAMMLIFGILSGSFTNPQTLPVWLQYAGRITPNAWALDGFVALGLGGGFADILMPLGALILMGLALFALTVFLFLRRGGLQR